MPKNNGKPAEAGFLVMVRGAGAIVERFWDQADLRGRNGGRAVGDFPKPADFLVTWADGRLQYAEVKSCHGKTSFPFSAIQPGQCSAALRQATVNGPYDFFIYSYHHAQWYIMPCRQFAAIKAEGRSSAKYSELTTWIPNSLT